MHCIQYIAAKSDTAENAHSQVKQYLEAQMGDDDTHNTWYDWFVTGGGRWASDENAQYDDSYTADVVHQDSPKFQEYLDTAHKYKLEAVEADLKYARDINIAAIFDNIENNQEGLYPMYTEANALYPFKKLYDHVISAWGPDSYFFDIENDTTHPTYMREGIDKGDKNWYLVPVDFHV
jgi:hypothetical protein